MPANAEKVLSQVTEDAPKVKARRRMLLTDDTADIIRRLRTSAVDAPIILKATQRFAT